MPITCGARTRRSSGREERRMAAETKRECVEVTIRAFRPADAAAVTSILREALEAAKWPGEGYREALNWPGLGAFAGEDGGEEDGVIFWGGGAGGGGKNELTVTPACAPR